MSDKRPVGMRGVLPVCKQCGGPLERLQRSGIVQHKILPLFHRYPWRCVLCNHVTYRTARNRAELRRQHGVV